MDLFDVEAAATSIDQLIERRSASQEEANRIEAAWAESARRHWERRRERSRELWRAYYLDQAERLERTAAELAADHRAKVEALLEEPEVNGA